jgi:hypothetical protein
MGNHEKRQTIKGQEIKDFIHEEHEDTRKKTNNKRTRDKKNITAKNTKI